MSETLKKFGAPAIGKDTDAGKSMKLAQRVEKILKKCINDTPKQLEPQTLLVDPKNRDGAPPNVQHVHKGILRSFQTAGYDSSRPQIGICVQYISTEGKARLIEHNKRFTSGSSMLPPVVEDKACYGTIAGSHLNIALRILSHGVHSDSADVTTMVVPGSSLAEVTSRGHKWWVLPENTDLQDLVDVSLWRNQDQRGKLGCASRALLRPITRPQNSLKIDPNLFLKPSDTDKMVTVLIQLFVLHFQVIPFLSAFGF